MWCAVIIDHNYGDGQEIMNVFTSNDRRQVVDRAFQNIKKFYTSGDPRYQPSQYFVKYGEMMNGSDQHQFRTGRIEIHQTIDC